MVSIQMEGEKGKVKEIQSLERFEAMKWKRVIPVDFGFICNTQKKRGRD